MTKPTDDIANGGRERREPTFHRDGAHTNVRLEELLLWIGNHLVRTTGAETVETARVGRLAWAVELAVYATSGTIITGSRYERGKNGRVGPVNAAAAVASLTRRGRAKGRGELRWQPLIAENRAVFDPADAAAIERALAEATTPGARPPVAAELIDKLAAGTPIPYEAVFLAEPTATEDDAAAAREWMRDATARQPKTEARSDSVRIGARTVAAIERIADRIEEHDDDRNCSLEDLCVELAEAWHDDRERNHRTDAWRPKEPAVNETNHEAWWNEASGTEPSDAELLRRALEQARGAGGDIDPEQADCPLCRAAAGKQVSLVEAISSISAVCGPCGESIGGNAEAELLRELQNVR